MPASSFFPLGFDAPGARISLIYYSFRLSHFLFPFVMYILFLFPFFFSFPFFLHLSSSLPIYALRRSVELLSAAA